MTGHLTVGMPVLMIFIADSLIIRQDNYITNVVMEKFALRKLLSDKSWIVMKNKWQGKVSTLISYFDLHFVNE
jgi:hypothetical protein